MLPGASPSNALRMGKHTVLEIFGKKHSSAGAVLKGTAGHNINPFPKIPCPAKRVASGGMIRGMFRRYVSGVCFGVCFALPC